MFWKWKESIEDKGRVNRGGESGERTAAGKGVETDWSCE